MAQSTALVAVPFYAPVKTDTSAFFKFDQPSPSAVRVAQRVRSVASEPNESLLYDRDGRFLADTRIGTRVNVYI